MNAQNFRIIVYYVLRIDLTHLFVTVKKVFMMDRMEYAIVKLFFNYSISYE